MRKTFHIFPLFLLFMGGCTEESRNKIFKQADNLLGKDLLDNPEQRANSTLPELKSGELILLASLEHRAQLTELLTQLGLQKNQHWVLFS